MFAKYHNPANFYIQIPDPNKINGHTDTFPFGKYRDMTLGAVLEKNPGYFLWVEKAFKDFKITKGIMDAAKLLVYGN